jgi:hypothetical protein
LFVIVFRIHSFLLKSFGFPTRWVSVYVAEMGWTFNAVNPDAVTNAPAIAAVGIVFTVLSALVVSLRLYVRSSIVKKIIIGRCSQLGIALLFYLIGISDDWIIVVTWVCVVYEAFDISDVENSFCHSFL